MLDAYSYTGGFGILAAKAGAKEVICLDSSEAALALAEESAAANPFPSARSKRMCSRNWNGWRRRKRNSTSSSPIRRLS